MTIVELLRLTCSINAGAIIIHAMFGSFVAAVGHGIILALTATVLGRLDKSA